MGLRLGEDEVVMHSSLDNVILLFFWVPFQTLRSEYQGQLHVPQNHQAGGPACRYQVIQ